MRLRPQSAKEESEKAGLKLNIQKTKIMASSPITSWQIDGEKVEADQTNAPCFARQMFLWNSLAFSMIQQMLAIQSLVPLPFLKPA